MAQPISLGTVLGGRYIVLDEVQTTSDGDHVLGGKDQILGREVTILVPSEAHTARVVENARITYLSGYRETLEGSGEKVTPDTVFRWASVSKGVAGTMVAKLAEQGKIKLWEIR